MALFHLNTSLSIISHNLSHIVWRAIISILVLTTISPVLSAPYFQKITPFFKKNGYEKKEQKKYTVPLVNTLTIKNINGTITIVTKLSSDPTHNSIFMQATKKASSPELCDALTIDTLLEETTLTITTADSPAAHSGAIDYYLIVPAPLSLILETQKGNIHIENNHGILTATTIKGNIVCSNSHHTASLHIKETGSITVEQAHKPLQTTTKKGPITIHDAHDAITAYSQKGKITAHLTTLPQQGNIQLKTDKGLIALHMPRTTHAHLHAQTNYGTVTSDHLVTLQPQTTRLNTHAWNNFKKEVRGTLGTIEQSSPSIMLSSHKSNIHIADSVHA